MTTNAEKAAYCRREIDRRNNPFEASYEALTEGLPILYHLDVDEIELLAELYERKAPSE